MFIELLRTDSLYVGKIRISSLVGLICFVVGLGMIIWKLIKSKKQNDEPVLADPAFSESEATENTEEYVDVTDKLGSLLNKDEPNDNSNENETKETEDGTDN